MKLKLVLIGVFSSIVIAGLWYFLLWSPQGKNIDKAKADEAAAEVRSTQLQVRLDHLKRLEANAAILEQDRQSLANAIPAKDQLDEFILQVNQRATEAGVSFVSVAPQNPGAGTAPPAAAPPAGGPAAAAATPVGLSINVTGDYFQVLTFLEKLRDGPRLVTVESFSLTPSGDDKTKVVSAAIGGRMFIYPDGAASLAPTTAGA